MTEAALEVLNSKRDRWWLMIEAGDVDWANHANNLDNSIGAVYSGEDAFSAVTDYLEKHKLWDDAIVIVTADHGHYFNLVNPAALVNPNLQR
jgi:alkaline phosphatase